MNEHFLFLTGKLAEDSLRKTLSAMQPEFRFTVHQLGLSVAALMTTEMIMRRLKDTYGADRVILPGRFRGDTDALAKNFGIPFERGPEELKDLPQFFGKRGNPVDLSRYDILIFGEIVGAPELSVEQILELARQYRNDGANIIDLGFIPETPFDHLTETIRALKSEDFRVSVDTHDPDILLTAAHHGADYLLSLSEKTLWVAGQTDAVPILLPTTPEDADSLYRCIDALEKQSKPFIADPVLDPIHCGFGASLARYYDLRQRYPDIDIMMGVGNLTELTHADSAGVNALLFGIASELDIRYVLTTQVSEHCRRAIKEADTARRVMYWCRSQGTPPTQFGNIMCALHERNPFPNTEDEIKQYADATKDRNYRVQLSRRGIHVYNRDLYTVASDPFDVYPQLELKDDVGHAFYLGVELARAQIAWQLGKRYEQDEELLWGCAIDAKTVDLTKFQARGTTFKKKAKQKKTNEDDKPD